MGATMTPRQCSRAIFGESVRRTWSQRGLVRPSRGRTTGRGPLLRAQPSQQGKPASSVLLPSDHKPDVVSQSGAPGGPADRGEASEAAGGWGPLRWLLGGWAGRPATAASTMPEVNVSLSDAAREPVFELLYRLYMQYGPIFKMNLGPKSFYVVSDPSYAKQIFVSNVDRYNKGILAEILEFVMGQGLLAADGEQWNSRRRAVAPALQRKFVASQVALFAAATANGLPQLEAAAATGGSVEMESFFSRLSLDVVGKSIFDYEFNALTRDDPVIQAVYQVLREAESRSTSPLPYWKLPGASLLVPRLRASEAALAVVNDTLDRLVARCKEMVDAEGATFSADDYSSSSVLQYLVASGEDIRSRQLRDDLMTLLIAGHETTAAALTWALHLLVQNPAVVAAVRQEVDAVLGDRLPTADDLGALRYSTRVVCEALRLYPQPPVLIRRAEQDDVLGDAHVIPRGSDLFIAVWNLHRSPQLWDDPEAFRPERFGPLEGPQPTEVNTDYRYMPFGAGRRKCVGEQFALMEATVALAVLLRRFDFATDPSKPPVGTTTGATIHTSGGLHLLVTRRDLSGAPPPLSRDEVAAAAAAAAAAAGCPHAAAAAAAAAAGCPYASSSAAAGVVGTEGAAAASGVSAGSSRSSSSSSSNSNTA